MTNQTSRSNASFLQSLETIERTPVRPFVQTEAKKKDSRIFEYTHISEEMASHAALGYFQIHDPSLLKCDILKAGRKKFLFFGPSKKTFKYTVRPALKKLIIPFLQEIFELARLDIHPNITSQNVGSIKIQLSGSDLQIISKNQTDIINALETITKIYTAKKVFIPKNTKFQIEYNQKHISDRKSDFNIQAKDEDSIDNEKDLIARVEKLKKRYPCYGQVASVKISRPFPKKGRPFTH